MNGLRATFLRSGNSGVIPFHSVCGDAPEIENKTSSEDTINGLVNQDAALAMDKGAAMKELLSLPLAELERRCRHNGLSLVGGSEMMVARLLYLEEAEKQRGYELDDDLKYTQSQSSSARHSSVRKEITIDMEPVGLSGWSHYGVDETRSRGNGSLPVAPNRSVPQPGLKASVTEEDIDHVLPASKWAREDDENEDEQQRSPRDLGLSYSSSGSENVSDSPRAGKIELATELSISAHPDIGMNEEQRYFILPLLTDAMGDDGFWTFDKCSLIFVFGYFSSGKDTNMWNKNVERCLLE